MCEHKYELFTDKNSGMKMWICKECGDIKLVTGEI